MAQMQGVQQGPPAYSAQPYIVDSLLQMDMKGVGSFYYDNFVSIAYRALPLARSSRTEMTTTYL